MALNANSYAGSNEFILPKGNLMIFAPPVVNKDYFLIEFGFVTEKSIKSWSYKYNAYVTAALFQDWLDKGDLRAGALGFKGGVMLPTQPWIPLLLTGSFGFAKTALHKNPFLGKDASSVAQKDMIFLEAGALYHYDQYFIRFAYQRSNVKYFTRHTILMFGVNY
jgi:hypothetical protein